MSATVSDGRLIIYSAISLDEVEMNALESYGTPAFLIVPGDIRTIGSSSTSKGVQ